MNRLLRLPALILLPVLLGCVAIPASAASGSPHPDDMVLTEDGAMLLDQPELVAEGAIARAAWSPSGEHVLVQRARPDLRAALAGKVAGEASLVVWKAAGGQRREVWRGDGVAAQVLWLEWLTGSEAALVLADRPVVAGPASRAGVGEKTERWLLHVDARRSRSHWLFAVPDDTQLSVSPVRPLAVLTSPKTNSLRIVQADGAVRDYGGTQARWQLGSAFWADDGTKVAVIAIPKEPDSLAAQKITRYLLDPATGKLVVAATRPRPAFRSSDETGPLQLRSSETTVRDGESTRELRPLWIEARKSTARPRALVSPDSPGGTLSPGGNAVLYTGEGGAYVRRMYRMERAVYQAAVDRAERNAAMFRLKQLGTALLMYSQDNEETLPGADVDLHTALHPYLKRTSLLQGFTYDFSGGKLADIAEPSKTILGHTPVPGGRVNVFVDGHVTYEPVPGSAGPSPR